MTQHEKARASRAEEPEQGAGSRPLTRIDLSDAEIVAALQDIARLRKKCATVFIESEWQRVLLWRDKFLDGEDDESLEPLDYQQVCFAIADAMTLREMEPLILRLESRLKAAELKQFGTPDPLCRASQHGPTEDR